MRVRLWSWIAALAAASSASAWAQDAELFEKLDANKDGTVTADEVKDDQRPLFERLLRQGDKDDDKKLTKEEFAAGLKPRERDRQPLGEGGRGDRPAPGEIFKRLDRDGDGKLSQDEAQGRMKEGFERIDANSDGSITQDELRRFFAAFRPGGEGGRPPGGRPEGGRPEGDRGRGPGPVPLLRALDADRDGELSADEISNAPKALAKLDKNEDGKLSRDELFPRRPDTGGRGPGARPGDGGEFFRRLREADTDGDGKLSKEEAPERMKENFDRIDRNSDGQIDQAEIRQMFERMREGGRRPEEGRGDRPRGDQPRGEREGGDRDRPRGDREREREDRERNERPERERE